MPLATNEMTVAQLLKQAGYETACFGKWGLGPEGSSSTPPRRGFDEWFGYLDQQKAHDYYPESLWRRSAQAGVNEFLMPLPRNLGGQQGDYSHDLFTKAATNFVRIEGVHPFFLYLAYTVPHANTELKEKGMQVPSDEPYSREPWPQPEKNKAAMITRLDRDVGLLMAQLQRQHLDQDTVLFFSSDNGPHQEGGVRPEFFHSAGPLRGLKRALYEGGIRVPMIAWGPGRIPAGVTNDQVWAFWDFLPTAAEMAGVTPPAGLDGLSVWPALQGLHQTNQHDFLYWEVHEDGSSQAVRMGTWKAVRLGPSQPLELYDLRTDRSETNNLAAAEPAVLQLLETRLQHARTQSTRWPLLPRSDQRPRTRVP
jgi:arylsulfatase A-like enzyme